MLTSHTYCQPCNFYAFAAVLDTVPVFLVLIDDCSCIEHLCYHIFQDIVAKLLIRELIQGLSVLNKLPYQVTPTAQVKPSSAH